VAEKHNEVEDAKVYDEIIQILSEHSSPQKEKLAGEPSVADPPTTSPFSNHRMALTISQNQLAIKNLERESTHLKAEVEDLKKELLALKKLINDKSLEDTPKSPSPSENANTPPKSATRTAASRARKKVDNGEESVKKQIRRPHSVMVTGSGQDFTNPHKKKKTASTDDLHGQKDRDRFKKTPERGETVSSGKTKKEREKEEEKEKCARVR